MNALRMSRLIGLALEHRRGEPKSQELLGLEAELEAEEMEREKGKNPAAFLLKRIDLTGAPFPIFLDLDPLSGFRDTAKVRLLWLPDGDRDYVEEHERRPAPTVFDEKMSLSATVRVTRRPARKLAYGIEIDQGAAFRRADVAAETIVGAVQHHTGHRPRVKTELETFREMKAKR